MSKLADIERAIEALPLDEYNALRLWFEEREAQRVDDWLESEVMSGRFDEMAKQAIEDDKAGLTRDL
jgi:hypothetical protein